MLLLLLGEYELLELEEDLVELLLGAELLVDLDVPLDLVGAEDDRVDLVLVLLVDLVVPLDLGAVVARVDRVVVVDLVVLVLLVVADDLVDVDLVALDGVVLPVLDCTVVVLVVLVVLGEVALLEYVLLA